MCAAVAKRPPSPSSVAPRTGKPTPRVPASVPRWSRGGQDPRTDSNSWLHLPRPATADYVADAHAHDQRLRAVAHSVTGGRSRQARPSLPATPRQTARSLDTSTMRVLLGAGVMRRGSLIPSIHCMISIILFGTVPFVKEAVKVMRACQGTRATVLRGARRTI